MSRCTYNIAAGFGLLLWFCACDTTGSEPVPESPSSYSLRTSTGGETISLGHKSASTFVYVEASSDWVLDIDYGSHSSGWVSTDVSVGRVGQTAVLLSVQANVGTERQATIVLKASDKRQASIQIIQQSGDGSPGIIPPGEIILGDLSLIECPRLSGGTNNYFITHRTEGGNRVNYSVEYDVSRRNPRWVAFSFDVQSAAKIVSRTNPDPWDWDPYVPAEYAIGAADYSGSGFTRGHICASEDRVFSREANVQTFYYTNLSPQRYGFNTGIWLQLESLVRGWGRSNSLRDILYVAKGGTIRDDQVESKLANGRIPVPRYFWMAVLLRKNTQWRAVGFWTEHFKPLQISNLQSVAVSIDELEQRTGINFFHNLPDDIEREVEAQSPKEYSAYWPGL